MADQEEDYSSLPLIDRFSHKNWKVRKEGYEAAAKEFNLAQTEQDPVVNQFIQDPGLWKAAVADSNVAAQQEALLALCSFLQIAGTRGCLRTRSLTVAPIAEKGLCSTRPAAKQNPVVEELLPLLSHKQPKIIAATLAAFTSIYHVYGCKTVEPKAVLKILPKAFGHADKNVRLEAQNLTVELYRWLKDAMKPLFWNELKPVQQQDLEKLFEKFKDEQAPKQERLLRSQQAVTSVLVAGGDDEAGPENAADEDDGIDLEPDLVNIDVMAKVPKDLHERLASAKWKDRKEALDDLHKAFNCPAIQDGHFDEIVRELAKCMKDANIAVVIVAANCVESLAQGLRKSFARYRALVMSALMERLKEKKQSVADAIGQALDAVFSSAGLSDCLEDILGSLKHKNPQIKLESTRFLIRSLKTAREAPDVPESKVVADAAAKLLTEPQETQRSAGAEVLGILWKIMGDRIMGPHLDGLDEIRKSKIKEYYESVEVKAKFKPKPTAPPPKPAAAVTQKKPVSKKSANTQVKKGEQTTAPELELEEQPPAAALQPRPTSRPGAPKLGAPKSGLAAPTGALKIQKRPPGTPSIASPKRLATASVDESSVVVPNLVSTTRGLAGRPLSKNLPSLDEEVHPTTARSAPSGSSAIERAELEELRTEVERLRRQSEEMRSERIKLHSQLGELQNQNAQLIEDHTRDMLNIKAKETQLTRARSDAEAAEQTLQSQQREVERLKRELSRQVRANSPAPMEVFAPSYEATALNGTTRYDSGYNGFRSRVSSVSPGEGKESVLVEAAAQSKLSLSLGLGVTNPSVTHSTSHSELSGRATSSSTGTESQDGQYKSRLGAHPNREGMESWKRAAEVTENLKARIEQMKARQGLASRPR